MGSQLGLVTLEPTYSEPSLKRFTLRTLILSDLQIKWGLEQQLCCLGLSSFLPSPDLSPASLPGTQFAVAAGSYTVAFYGSWSHIEKERGGEERSTSFPHPLLCDWLESAHPLYAPLPQSLIF